MVRNLRVPDHLKTLNSLKRVDQHVVREPPRLCIVRCACASGPSMGYQLGKDCGLKDIRSDVSILPRRSRRPCICVTLKARD